MVLLTPIQANLWACTYPWAAAGAEGMQLQTCSADRQRAMGMEPIPGTYITTVLIAEVR